MLRAQMLTLVRGGSTSCQPACCTLCASTSTAAAHRTVPDALRLMSQPLCIAWQALSMLPATIRASPCHLAQHINNCYSVTMLVQL